MHSNLPQHIYNTLNLKETDELMEIWKQNDRVQWSQETFDALETILQERLGQLPPQNPAILEFSDESEYLPIDENQPEFYDPHKVLQLVKWLRQAAIISVIAALISNLISLPQLQKLILSYFMDSVEKNVLAWLIAIVTFIFTAGLQSIIIYFLLNGLGTILKILMDMEFNSRRLVKAKNA